jgi:hypothetical protein
MIPGSPSCRYCCLSKRQCLPGYELPRPCFLPAYGANLIADMFWVGLLTAPVLCLSLYLSFLITRPLARFTLMARRISLDDEISSPFVGPAEPPSFKVWPRP